jgi:hypothetical protein
MINAETVSEYLIEKFPGTGDFSWGCKCAKCGKDMLFQISLRQPDPKIDKVEIKMDGGAAFGWNPKNIPEKLFDYFKCQACFGGIDGNTLIYSRVVGYFSPTNMWNPGKVSEFRNRKTFKGVEIV